MPKPSVLRYKGIILYLLQIILNVNCLPNNPPNSIPFHGQNAPAAPNFWTGQPAQSVLQGMTNIFDAMNPNPSQNTYLNNNDNQQNIKYDQQYSTPQPYNSPHNYNQQYSMSQPYNAQPHNYKQQSSVPQPYNAPPYNYEQQLSELPTYNSPTHNYEQQSSVIQPYNAPQVIQKNQNQHSKQPRLYNLHPPSQSSGPTNSQSFGTIGPSLKEYQKQLPKSINQPIEILPAFGQPINNAKNQENIQQSSPPIPSIPNKSQLSQMASKVTKPIVKESSKSNGYNIDFKEAEVPDFVQPNINAENQNIIQQSSPPIPPIPNQPQLSQMASKLSKPIVKESSKSNGYNIDIKEAELPDFGQPNINAKNQNIIQQSSPPISPIPNQPQLSQMASKLSKPIVKESSKSNGYNIDIKEAEVPDLGQPISNSKNKKNIQQSSSPNEYDTEIKEEVPDFNQVIYNAENQGNNPSSAPSFPHIPNQFQLSKPIVKGSSTSDGYNVDNEEAEVPDFGQPKSNSKNQENVQQSSSPIPSIPNQSQLSQMASKLSKPIVKESSKSNGYNIDIKKSELPDFGQPNIYSKDQNNIQQSSPPIPPTPNQPQLSQMASKLTKPIVKESSKSNGYNIDIKEAELPDFGQPNINAKNQNITQQSSPLISPIPNQPQLSQMASKLTKPIVKESSKSNGYNIDIKEAEVPDLGQPISNSKNKKNIQQSSSPNEYDTEIKEEVPDFDQVIYNAENQGNNPSSAPSFPHIPNQFQLSKPIVKGSSTSDGYNVDNEEAEVPDFGQPKSNSKNKKNIHQSSSPNEYDTEIKEEVPDLGQPINNAKNQENVQQSSSPIPSIPHQSQLSQMVSKLSKPIVKESSKSNGYNIDIKKSELPDFGQPNIYSKDQNNIQQSSPPIPPTPNQPQLSQMASKLTKPIVKESSKSNGYNIDIKEAEVPDFVQPNINAKNQNIIQQSSPPISSIPNQFQLSKPIVKESFTPNGYDIEIKEEVPYFGQPINNAKHQENVQQSSPPNEYDTEIKKVVPDFYQVTYNAKNEGNKPSSAPDFPPNQSKISPIPSQSSSKLTLNENTMQIKNDNMSLNSLLGLPDGHSEPLINDFAQNVDVLIDNSQTDIQSFLNSENNNIRNPSSNVLENQDDFQLVFNDVPPQLPMNVQAANAIINSQSNDLISNMDLNNDTENLQNTSNEDSLPENVEDTELNEESKLEKAMSESPVVALGDIDTENDKLYSLENLVFDVPPSELDRISNYDTSFIVDTENPKNAKEDNAKITVYANPNDVHILQLSPKQSSTNDNSYLINNNLLNTPSTGMPLWYSSFPNGADYVEHFNSNTNKQLSNSFFNFNQNPAYNQIPMYLENSNYFNQQAAVDQNQITSKIQSPGLSLDDNQPSSMDNSGSIYKKVDLKNPPPNSSNSWSLLKKDYTKNLQPNQYDRYTSGDGTTRTSFFGTPLSSYQNSNQGILNLPSNDMFVRNMISVISNSVQAPLDGTKAIFDITSANFPRSSVSHIIRLTHAIVRSVMLNLRQTLNTFMKTLYGHRVKRDFNPFEVLHNLPGALVNKYSLQSTAASTTKNINSPYYNQPTTADQTTAALFTGQQTTADYSMSQSVTKNMLGRQEAYGNEIDRNYYGSQNNNIGVVPQPASTQNYVLNSLIDAITSAVRSNVPAPYSIDSPEVKQYTQQVIVTAEIVFKNQIDNTLHGQSPTLNMY